MTFVQAPTILDYLLGGFLLLAVVALLYRTAWRVLPRDIRISLTAVMPLGLISCWILQWLFPTPMKFQYAIIAQEWAQEDLVSRAPANINYPGTALVYGLLARVGSVEVLGSAMNIALFGSALTAALIVLYKNGLVDKILKWIPWTLFFPAQMIFLADIGKEALVGPGVLLMLASAIAFGLGFDDEKRSVLHWWAVFGSGCVLLGIARPTQIVVVAPVAAFLIVLRARPARSGVGKAALAGAVATVFYFTFLWLQTRIGGTFNISGHIASAAQGDLVNFLELKEQESGLSARLRPTNAAESVLFSVPRSLLVSLSPIGSSIPAVFDQLRLEEQVYYVAQYLSVGILLLALPFVPRALVRARQQKVTSLTDFFGASVVMLIIVSASTIIIVPRYRYPLDVIWLMVGIAGIYYSKTAHRWVGLLIGAALTILATLASFR